MTRITTEVFKDRLQCKYKAFLRFSRQIGVKSDYENMLSEQALEFKIKAIPRYFHTVDRLSMASILLDRHEKSPSEWRKIFIDAEIDNGDISSQCDVLEKVPGKSNLGNFHYIPTLLIEKANLSREDKILLGFNGLVIGDFQDRIPAYGRIIHGHNFSCSKIKMDKYIGYAKEIIAELKGYIDKNNQPRLILNHYCRECGFMDLCKTKAIEMDDLSLLSGMTEKEIDKQNQKGIFTVTQYSYTFRPRKRRKLLQSNSAPRMLELKALAVRTGKVYVYDKPILNISNPQIYIDVEGDPNRGFNYLIGIVTIQNGIETRESFWANDFAEEDMIFAQFLKKLDHYNEFSLFHYGSYETRFFKKMKNRIEERHVDLYEKIIKNSTNILSLIYSNIYFPTYSNDLKDVGKYLGVKWTEEDASGIQSMVWRRQWEVTKSDELKSKLIQYNIEDCLALKKVTESIKQLNISFDSQNCQNNAVDCVSVNDMKPDRKFGTIDFFFKDLNFVNNCAYFDYQRQKIFCKTSPRLVKKKVKRCYSKILYKANRHIDIPIERKCFNCGKKTYRYGTYWKKQLDLKFTNKSIKRWVVSYRSIRMNCKHCKKSRIPQKFHEIPKYGHGLLSWTIYHNIVHHQPFGRMPMDLEAFFDMHLPRKVAHQFKKRAARYYENTYDAILDKLIHGDFIHIDETKVNVKGCREYVWVLTNMEEVAFMHTATREGDFLKELLRDFRGVLISDFYAVYDSINCPQQKCLIHLIRDLNDDLQKNPFDEEYKDMSSKFSILLREIIATVDKDGLKKRYLNKHNRSVERYFDYILNNTYKSDLALKYQKRFEKTRGKLFTFMNYNGVPWNNNNAEHAIKHFADYRNTVAGQIREFGLRNYLMLLSAYQTCEYKGISFLKFLLSKETDIDKFRLLKNKVKIQDDFDPHYSSDVGKYDRSDNAFFA
jgi:predicted RecB family nuclease